MKKQVIFLIFIISSGVCFSQNEQDSITKQLETVNISSLARAITNKNGNIKVDVANSIYRTLPNAIDLLSKLPKIQIGTDRESLSVIGKGAPLLYLDNQKITVNDLNSLSVDDIKTIEIIQNPSSKYEAEGKVVILITRKFSRKEGFNVSLSETAAFRKKFNNYAGVNSSFKTGQTEFKANFDYNALHPWESNGIDYEIPAQQIAANYRVGGFTKREQYVFGAGIFQQLNADDYISFSASDRIRKDRFDFDTKTFNSQPGLTETIKTLGTNGAERNFLNTFLNYSNKIKSIDAVLSGGLQYSRFTNTSDIASFNNYNDTQFMPFQGLGQDFEVSVFSGRADFEKKFIVGMKLEMGGLLSDADAKTNVNFADFEQPSFSQSQYHLTERNSAAYTTLSGTIKKISWNAGIRAENTNIKGIYKNDSAPLIRKDYTKLFPKIDIEIPIDSSKTISFNYSKSIDRPDYSATSQGVTYINPYFAFASNINLDPTISEIFAANFQYRNKSVRATYYETTGAVYYGFTYAQQKNLLTFQPENFEKESGYEVEFTLPLSRGIWSSVNNLNFYLTKVEDAGAVVNKARPYIYAFTNHIFSFRNEWTLSATVWGLTRQQQGIYEKRGFFIMDLAASKTLFKSLTCTLSANNIFRNTTYREKFDIAGVRSTARYYTDTYDYSVALKYTFGKIKDSAYEEKNVDETTRIK